MSTFFRYVQGGFEKMSRKSSEVAKYGQKWLKMAENHQNRPVQTKNDLE